MRKRIKIPQHSWHPLRFPLFYQMYFLSVPAVFQLQNAGGSKKSSVCCGWAREYLLPSQKSACQPKHPPLNAHTQAVLTLCSFSFLRISSVWHLSSSPTAFINLFIPRLHEIFQPIFLAAAISLPSTFHTVASNHHAKIPSVILCQGNIS